MKQILSHKTVLHTKVRDGFAGDVVTFSREADDLSDLPDVYMMNGDDWRDMGRPKTVTVTVNPGDELNG